MEDVEGRDKDAEAGAFTRIVTSTRNVGGTEATSQQVLSLQHICVVLLSGYGDSH